MVLAGILLTIVSSAFSTSSVASIPIKAYKIMVDRDKTTDQYFMFAVDAITEDSSHYDSNLGNLGQDGRKLDVTALLDENLFLGDDSANPELTVFSYRVESNIHGKEFTLQIAITPFSCVDSKVGLKAVLTNTAAEMTDESCEASQGASLVKSVDIPATASSGFLQNVWIVRDNNATVQGQHPWITRGSVAMLLYEDDLKNAKTTGNFGEYTSTVTFTLTIGD